MELVITGFGDKGNLQNERIGLKALKECDLKYYQLFKTKFTENNFYNRSSAVFWFAPRIVKAGDKIIVYTKVGADNIVINPDGTTNYFLYWGLSEPIFDAPDKGVVLAELVSWENSLNK